MVESESLLMNGDTVFERETEEWLRRVALAVEIAVGTAPDARLLPYRKGCGYLGLDFFERGFYGTRHGCRSFSITIAIAPYGKPSLDEPQPNCDSIEPTVLDGVDAICMASILTGLVKVNRIFFNERYSCS